MPSLSRAQEAGRRLILIDASRGGTPEELGQRFLSALDSALPSDGQRMFGVDPSTLLFNRLLAASPGDGPNRRRWLQHIYLKDFYGIDYYLPPELMRRDVPVLIYAEHQDKSYGLPKSLRDQVRPDLHRQGFHDGNTPAGGSLRVFLGTNGHWLGMLDIVRRNAVRQFLQSDLYFLKVVGPIMSRALEASLARERAMRETSSLAHAQASGVLLVSPSRKIEFATPAGEAWLKLLHDAGRDGHAPLLTPVWSAIAGLTASGREHFVSSVTAQTMRGPVRVEASPAGEEGRIAVVLAPIQPPEPPSIPISWELTAQERRVVECLLRGMTNQQISASLFVTENTVEAHLRSIYTKLDVRSRLELLARLFRETGWASFDFGNEGR